MLLHQKVYAFCYYSKCCMFKLELGGNFYMPLLHLWQWQANYCIMNLTCADFWWKLCCYVKGCKRLENVFCLCGVFFSGKLTGKLRDVWTWRVIMVTFIMLTCSSVCVCVWNIFFLFFSIDMFIAKREETKTKTNNPHPSTTKNSIHLNWLSIRRYIFVCQ